MASFSVWHWVIVMGWPGMGIGMFTHPVPAAAMVTLWTLAPVL
jgi:hypothetical protein